MIRVSAPGRCGVLGNPTDMYGGSVIACTTAERATCELSESATLTLDASGETTTITDAAALAAQGDIFDLARAVLRGMNVDPTTHRFHLRTTTEIPMQAGLAGSTALIAAIYGAVAEYLGIRESRHAMSEAIRRIEYEQMGVICGFQDQCMTVFGGLNYMDFRDKGSHLPPDAQPLPTIESLIDDIPAALPLLLATTGVKHHSGSAHKPVRQRWMEGDPAVVGGYERLARLTRDTKSALLAGDWETLAAAMNENLRIQQEFGASGEACDRLAEVAMQNGALAAKLAGAGQGGTVLVLTHEPERAATALQEAGAARILYPAPSPGLTVERL